MNEYEKAAKEFLKGCSCTINEEPEKCEECLKAYLDQIKSLKEKEQNS